MTTKPQSFKDLEADLLSRLYEIKGIVELCGFAAEARRALDDVNHACDVNHALATQLERRVESRNEYLCHRDSLPLVLKSLAQKVESTIGVLDAMEVRDVRS